MRSNPHCNGNRRDKVALKTNCIIIFKFRIIEIRTGCQYIAVFLKVGGWSRDRKRQRGR